MRRRHRASAHGFDLDRRFAAAVEGLDAHSEVADQLRETGVGVRRVREEVTGQREVIVAGCHAPIQALDAATAACAAARADARGPFGALLRPVTAVCAVVLAALLVLAIVGAARPGTAWWLALALVALLGLAVTTLAYPDWEERRERRCDVPWLHSRVSEAQADVDTALSLAARDVGLEAIANIVEPVDPCTLGEVDLSGLSELHEDEEYDVDTAARQELRSLLSAMKGGTIGLSGPRGVGKSTLLRRIGATQNGALSVTLRVPARYEEREFFMDLIECICAVVAGPQHDRDVLVEPVRSATGLGWVMQYYVRLSSRILRRPVPPLAAGDGDPRDRGIELLREIRFQRTSAVGTGDEVLVGKGPVKMKMSSRKGLQATRLPWPHHRLVQELRQYLAALASERKVVIAIDELDRIGSPEEMTGFLNGLREIVGITGVFLLVAVSEEALAHFEQRGIGTLDAFYRAFDRTVPVEPLSLAESELLLRRRTSGLHWPFLAFAAMLGGGIPKQTFRAVWDCEKAKAKVGPTFGAIAEAVLSEEIQAAAGRAKEQVSGGQHELRSWLQALAHGQSTAAGLREALHEAVRLRRRLPVPSVEVLNGVELHALFALTALEVMDVEVQTQPRASYERGWVDELIHVRRLVASDSDLARVKLMSLRAQAGLVLGFPAPDPSQGR